MMLDLDTIERRIFVRNAVELADAEVLIEEVRQLRTDVRDLTQINDGYEETIVRLMEVFGCPNPNAVVEHIQALFEMLQNDLRIARAEATSVRPGPCVPERDETMFVDDAAPPKRAEGE